MSNKNTEYEIFVRGMSEYLLKAEGFKNVSVQHNVLVTGISGQKHQIDVYWEFILAGIQHKVALECKNYSKAIDIGKVRDFHSVLRDVAHLTGAMVTKVGFQSGAVKYAQAHGVGLKIIRPVENGDWESRVRRVILTTNIVSTIIENTRIMVDKEWVDNNLSHYSEDQIYKIMNQNQHSTLLFGDPPKKINYTLNQYLNKLYNGLPTLDLEDDNIHHKTFDMDKYYLEVGESSLIAIKAVEVSYRREVVMSQEAYIESAAKNIIKDVLSNRLLFVDEDGRISGDIENKL